MDQEGSSATKALDAVPQNEFMTGTPTANLMMLVCAATAATPANVKTESTTWNETSDMSSPTSDSPSQLHSIEEDNDAWIHSATGTSSQNDSKEQKRLQSGVDRSSISRKDKSLGLLCRKFLQKYPEEEAGAQIFLDDVARELDVERRRVYDIVNVFEGMEMLVRLAKNKYIWQGKSSLIKTLRKLKALAMKMYGIKKDSPPNFGNGTNFHMAFVSQSIDLDFDERYKEIIQGLIKLRAKENPHVKDAKDLTNGPESSRKEKSLGILCQKFLMLFIILQNHTVSLEKAAKILIDGEDDCCKSKTKVRRLYDIANILASMNLVEKTAVYDGSGRKAAFRWIGDNLSDLEPDEDGLLMQSEVCVGFTKHSMFLNGISDLKRKLLVRSMSANSIKPPSTRLALPRTLSTSNMDQQKRQHQQETQNTDGHSSTIDVSRISLFRSPSRLTSPTGHTVSPNERMFREEVRRLKERYPTKMPEPDGLLQLLTACKNESTTESASAPTSPTPAQERGRRRRLLERFDSDGAINAKRYKYEPLSSSNSQSIESMSNDGDSRHSSDLLSLAEVASESSVDVDKAMKDKDTDSMPVKEESRMDHKTKCEDRPYSVSLYSDGSDKDSDCDQELLNLTKDAAYPISSDVSTNLGGSSGTECNRYGEVTPSLTASIGIQTALTTTNHKKFKRNASTCTSPLISQSQNSSQNDVNCQKSPRNYEIRRTVQSSPFTSHEDKENNFYPHFCKQSLARRMVGTAANPPNIVTTDLLSKKLDVPIWHHPVPIAVRPVPVVGHEGAAENCPRIFYSPTTKCDGVNNAIQIIPISYPNVLPESKKISDVTIEAYDKLQRATKRSPLLPLSPINVQPCAPMKLEKAISSKTPICAHKHPFAPEETPSNFKYCSNIQRKLPTSLSKESS